MHILSALLARSPGNNAAQVAMSTHSTQTLISQFCLPINETKVLGKMADSMAGQGKDPTSVPYFKDRNSLAWELVIQPNVINSGLGPNPFSLLPANTHGSCHTQTVWQQWLHFTFRKRGIITYGMEKGPLSSREFFEFFLFYPHPRTFFLVFSEREEGRERNIDWLPPMHTRTRDHTCLDLESTPQPRKCAVTGGRIHNLWL